MHLQRIFKFLICLTFVVLANANSSIKKETAIKEPKVKVETIRINQPLKPSPISRSSPFDNSFMPVFLTSNVKTNDFTQEMLKSLSTNNFIKPITNPSVKPATVNKSNKQITNNDITKKIESKAIKSEAIVTRWSKAGSTNSNFAPVLPINLSKMHFDTTGFIPIVPKQSTRSSSNAKLVKQTRKPISRPTVNAKTVPLLNLTQQKALVSSSLAKNTSKRKTLIDLNKQFNKEAKILPNPSVHAIKPIKSNLKSISLSTATKPQKAVKPTPSKNAKIVDNRSIIAASSTELNSYINSQLTSRDARKALLKMNTLRYLAKLNPQWAASSLSETYQPSKTGGGLLNAYPIGKITIPSDKDSYGGGYKKKPEISIELIKEILHKLTNDDLRFNKLYVMGTHNAKNNPVNDGGYQPEENTSGYENNGGYQQDNLNQEKNSAGYQMDNKKEISDYKQPEQGGYNQPEHGAYNQDQPDQGYNQDQPDQSGYNQPEQGGYNQPEQGGYNQPEQGGYNQPEQGGYNQQDQGDYSQPDYSQPGGNSYGNGMNSNEMGNSYNSNDEGNSYSNQANSYNSDNGNSYQNGGDSDQEQGYHLQSLGYDMSQYTNRAYVPAYSLNSLASFVHSKFKETSMKKQMGEYQFMDNPYLNNYEDYKSMDVNYAQYVPGGKKKCSKNMNGGYANNDVNFDDSYNNYVKVIKFVPGVNIDFKK